MPSFPTKTSWPASLSWPSSVAWPSNTAWPVDFNGNFASLFTNVLQSVQTDLGLTYGGTLLATGTTPPAITLSGTLLGRPVPIQVNCTGAGGLGVWFGAISYDGGATTAQVFTSSASVALTGAGSGLTLSIAAGNAAIDNVWKATCSGLADQVGSNNYSQATLAQQFLVTPGVNGYAGIASYTSTAGSGQNMSSALVLPTSPNFVWGVFRVIGTTPALGLIIEDGNGSTTGGSGSVLDAPTAASTNTQMFNATGVNTNTASTLNQWGRFELSFTNSTSDYYKFGASNSTGANAGNGAQVAGRSIGSKGAPSLIEWHALIYMSAAPTAAQLASASAAVTAKLGGSVAV